MPVWAFPQAPRVHSSMERREEEEEDGREEGDLLMHVKCIHELFIILLIFQSYLHHIRVIFMIYIELWG